MEKETTHNDYYEIKEEEIFNQPIDYMHLEIDDFEGFNVTKDLIDIPVGKYLTETIINENIHPRVSDTTVINSSVGDGKTFLAIEMTRRFLTSEKYRGYGVIFVAPHKALVKEYKGLFKRVLPHMPIPHYEYLKEVPYDRTPNARNSKEARHPNNINYNCQLPLHVITIDCLTGNTEDGTEQAAIKRKYIENIISYGKEHKGKIIFVMDEIHDAIDNFKPELIPSLWRFKTSGILHKIFVLSATFNEASKVVIKYLADITDKNLHIVESTRKQLPDDRLSNLHIHITSSSYYNFEDE
jgi:superfamily II DNA or RNA helicase